MTGSEAVSEKRSLYDRLATSSTGMSRRTPSWRSTFPLAALAIPKRSPRPCCGFAVRGQATSSVMRSPSIAG